MKEETFTRKQMLDEVERRLDRALAARTALANARRDSWIDWTGGEMPIPKGTLLQVRLRHGKEHAAEAGEGYATRWTWDRSGDGQFNDVEVDRTDGYDDIVAYRLLVPFTPTPSSNVDVEAEIASVVQAVNEWDDRTSPDDYPEHLLITSEELALILRNFADTLTAATEGK